MNNKQTIEIKAFSYEVKPTLIPAEIYNEVFAIHPNVYKTEDDECEFDHSLWTVTHIPTGVAVIRGVTERSQCEDLVLNWLPFVESTDWTISDIDKLKDQGDGWMRATATVKEFKKVINWEGE